MNEKKMASAVGSYALLLLLGVDLINAVEFRIGFTRWPKWEVVGVPGSSVSLPCATNVSAEKISWQYNHHFLLSPPLPHPVHHPDLHPTPSVVAPFDVQEVEGGSELVVHLAERESQYKHQLGLYQCVAWFGAVALTSLPGRLRAALLEPYPEEEEAGRVELEVEEGQGVRVECGLPHSVPEAQVTFYKDGQPLSIHNSTAYHVTPHGDLVMGNVGAWAAGEYTCSAYNPALNLTVRRNTRTRVVVVRPTERTQPSPPHYVTLRSVYTGTVGSSVTLLCLANGHPKPRLRWSKYGGTLPPSSVQIEDGSLSITGLRVEDEGTYLCHAENGVGAALIVLDMLLEVLDPPQLVEGPASQEVEEGSSVSLNCIAHGHPPPKVMWVFNGRLVRNDSNLLITENGLRIARVEKEHAGIFQCFVHNPQGTVQKLAVIRVVPQTVTVAPNGTNHHHGSDRADNRKWSDGQEIDGMVGSQVHNEGRRNRNQNGRSKHRGTGRNKGGLEERGESSVDGVKRGKKKKGRMFPPSRPRVAKVSDESVMVSWDDPRQTGLPVMFYKIQYKVVRSRGNRGSHWMTVDEDIPPHIRSFEVTGLHTGRTYKFRMAAVYSNNDNMLGHTSRRFLLEKSRRLQPPATPPTITALEPKGPSAVNLVWQYDASSGTQVEGFFINYREATKAGDYTKVTVLGPSKREVLISHLKANVSYDFKIQAFNLAGASDFSPVHKKNVAGSVVSTEEEPGKEGVREEENLVPVVRSGDPAVSNMQLYIILGAVVGVLLLIVVISAAAYSCRHSHINDNTRSAKYEDTSLHIHREASTYSLPDDHHRNGQRHNGYLPHQGITVTSQDSDKVAMESSLIENNNHNIQDVERCYSSPARRIASEDGCELKNVALVRNSRSNTDVGIREASRT